MTHLVRDVWKRDVVIDFNGLFVVHEKVHDVSHGGRHPATSLIEELIEALRTMSVSITGSRVLYSVASLEQQRTKPSIFPC